MLSRELDGTVVLVVEDHLETLEGIAAILENAGATVAKAATYTDAVRLLEDACARGSLPDAIVCDMMLPDGSGATLPAHLRKLDPACRVPLIAVSAHPDAEGLAREAGFDDFLPKLVNPLLPLALAQLLQRQR
jgi:CheY-like chemotaxis protein